MSRKILNICPFSLGFFMKKSEKVLEALRKMKEEKENMIIFLPKVLGYSAGYLLVEQPGRLQTNRAYLATCVLTFCRNKKAIESRMNIIYPKQMQIPIKEPGYKYYFVLETYPMYSFRYIVS